MGNKNLFPKLNNELLIPVVDKNRVSINNCQQVSSETQEKQDGRNEIYIRVKYTSSVHLKVGAELKANNPKTHN